MAYSGVLDDIRTCINLGVPKQVPVFAISGEFDLKMSGIGHPEYSQDAEAMAKCQIEAVKRL